MNIKSIQEKIRAEKYVYTSHADIERKVDDLTLMQVEEALLNGEILEQYPDTGRGESCLILGYSSNLPIHIVCGWRGDRVAIKWVNLIKRSPESLKALSCRNRRAEYLGLPTYHRLYPRATQIY